MEYCTACGHSLNNGNTFCINCGAKQTDHHPPSRQVRASKKPMKKGTKTAIWFVAAAVILIFSAHQIISSKIDPMKTIKAMDRAMTTFDADHFFTHVKLDKEALLIKSEYLGYIDGEGWEEIRGQLEDIMDGKKGENFSVTDEDGSEFFQVKKKPFLLGIYDTYEIHATPQQIKAVTNLNPATLEMGGKSAEMKGDTEVVFKAYPGAYELQGFYENEFGEIGYEETVFIESNAEHLSDVSLYFPDEIYTIETDKPDAVLFINGKNTGKSLSEFEELGPFPEDEEVWMHAEWTDENGEVQRSEEISQYYVYRGTLTFWFDSYEYDFDYEDDAFLEEPQVTEEVTVDVDKFTAEEAGQYVLAFRDSYEAALHEADYSYIATFLDEGSDAALELEDYLMEIEGQGFEFIFQVNEVIEAEQTDENTYDVQTNEEFVFVAQDGKETYYVRVKDYTLTNTEDGLKITNIDINETERKEEG
ncbi:hypothetical protein [Halobacillus sp. Marseille-Q1614]|uniref:TcaA NTF2-like domain-containing protein n=1 Tax=Halobacillus sp. Marseille-Q1614 TaxID=2709134 RepID=UPI0015712E2B|nr:hypothetical protein [Halobacillus sp. Marseille-Q1614]